MNEDKVKSLLNMLDHVEQYTDTEMEYVLNEKEALAYYETIVMVKQALHSSQTRKLSFLRHQSILWKVASVIIILFFMGVFSYAAFHFFIGQSDSSVPISSVSINRSEENVEKNENKEKMFPKTVIFEQKTLHEVLDKISEYYKVNVKYEEEGIADLRMYFNWDSAEDIQDVLTLLNSFDHFHLELEGNTIIVSK